MDFYAFLPSNASPTVYPDNKTSHFKIELSKRMDLHGQWQAGLIELHYPNSIAQVLEGENEIILQTDQVTDIVQVKPGHYRTKIDFLTAVRDAALSLGNLFNQHDPLIETDDQRLVFQPISDKGKIFFSPRLALQLGLDNHGPFPSHKKIYGVKPVDITLGVPPQLFVYLDVLEEQIVGHTRAPLLRSVPVNTNASFGSMSIYHCEHPIYFDLNTKSFDTLEIDIRDHAGRYVPFEFGTSTLLVHFRKRS